MLLSTNFAPMFVLKTENFHFIKEVSTTTKVAIDFKPIATQKYIAFINRHVV